MVVSKGKEMITMLKNFFDWLEEHDLEAAADMPKDEIPGSWFRDHGLPMIVSCTCCGSTMALPSAMIDEDGHVYCSCCADE